MKKAEPFTFNSISELHRVLGLPKPLHPLISLVRNCDISDVVDEMRGPVLLNFYKIAYKENLRGKIKYGQTHYDFDEGGLMFVSPNQLMSGSDEQTEYEGFSLLFHPDFTRGYPLAQSIKDYGFFSYSVNEALHLSDQEKKTILGVFKNIESELKLPIDDFSQDVMIAQIELLLQYSNRYYKRQFTTRKAANNDLLVKLESILTDYFDNETALMKGLPTVQFLAEQLNISAHYLSDMLRSLTGQNAQQHIHNKLVEKAKEILTATNLSVSEIAYQLGFEHPQSFSKFFKSKTNHSPLEFRQSFN
ncbi:helix-turn-helix domain-containing protein [Chitinophagaceae bacterium MMS25-I14]